MTTPPRESVVCFLRNHGALLLVRVPEPNRTDGRWNAISTPLDSDPVQNARDALRSVTGRDDCSLVRVGDLVSTTEDGETSSIHPFLFESGSRSLTLDDATEAEWVSPTAIRRRETAPGLQRAYEHVAPTVETVAKDTDHGSAWLSVRALAVLRDRAGGLTVGDDRDHEPTWDDLVALADALRAARPSMAVVRNRINRAMANASDDRTADALERVAIETIERAFETDAAAAREAGTLLSGTVVTLSRSGTVLDALRAADDISVVVGESRPAREGVSVAEALVTDHSTTLAVDAALPHLLATRPVECVLVGADTVLPDGSVVNKVGTRGVAIAAAHEGIPVYAVTAGDKIATENEPKYENGTREAVYDGDASIDVANPTFDRTPAAFVTVVTEDGPLSPAEIGEQVNALAALADRAKDTSPDPE